MRKNGHTYALLDDDSAYNVFVTKRENRNYSVFTVVNAYESDKEYGYELDAAGKSVKFYDAVSGEIEDVDAAFAGGKVSFRYTLPANRTGFFVVEK